MRSIPSGFSDVERVSFSITQLRLALHFPLGNLYVCFLSRKDREVKDNPPKKKHPCRGTLISKAALKSSIDDENGKYLEE